MVAAVAAAGLTASLLVAVPGLTGTEPANGAANTVVAGKDPVEAAKQRAREQHKRVEIEAMRTEQSTTWANPDGATLHAELSSAPVRVNRDGAWIPVDTTLIEENGVVRPKATRIGLELPAGGPSSLIKIRRNGTRSAVRWPTRLPKPVLAGNTATYPDAVAAGVDLRITVAADGIDQQIVIRQRPAGALTVRLPVTLPRGMRYDRDTAGRQRLLGTDGAEPTVVADVSGAAMLDATAMRDGPGSGHRGIAAVSIGNDAAGPVLTLTPEARLLADARTAFPVTMAVPSNWVGAGLDEDTFISNVQYPNSQTSATWLRAGKSANGAETWRTYLKFIVGGTDLDGATILNADLRLWNYRSNDCGHQVGSGIVVRRITSAWDPATLTWSAQPAATTTHQSANQAAYSDLCSWGEGELFYSIEGIVQDWANGVADYGVQLRAVSESDATNWRQYRSSEYTGTSGRGPVLFVDYESAEEFEIAYERDGAPDGSTPSYEQLIADQIDANEVPNPQAPVTVEEAAARQANTTETYSISSDLLPDVPPEEEEPAPDPTPPDPSPTPTPPVTPTPSPTPTDPPVDETITLPLTAEATTTNWGFELFGDPSLVVGSYDWDDGTFDLSRTYLKFDTSALGGKEVRSATLKLWSHFGYCDTDAIDLKAFQVAGAWSPTTLRWNAQPATRPDGVAADAQPACEQQGYFSWPVTPIAHSWATGTANQGLQLRAVPESGDGRHEEYFDSSTYDEGETHPPTLVVTVRSQSGTSSASVTGTRAGIAAPVDFPYQRLDLSDCWARPGLANNKRVHPHGWVKNGYNWCSVRTVGKSRVRKLTFRGLCGCETKFKVRGKLEFLFSVAGHTFAGGKAGTPNAEIDVANGGINSRTIKMWARVDQIRITGDAFLWDEATTTLDLNMTATGYPNPTGSCVKVQGGRANTLSMWRVSPQEYFEFRSDKSASLQNIHKIALCRFEPVLRLPWHPDQRGRYIDTRMLDEWVRCDTSEQLKTYYGGCVFTEAIPTFEPKLIWAENGEIDTNLSTYLIFQAQEDTRTGRVPTETDPIKTMTRKSFPVPHRRGRCTARPASR